MSIRLKVGLAIASIFVVAGAGVVWTTSTQFDNARDRAAHDALSVAANSFAALETQDIEKLSAVNDVLRSRADLQELFVAKDRDGLYEATAPLFEELREKYGITHLYFIEAEPDSEIFLRVHNKDKSGDVNERDTYTLSVESKSYGAGKDLGKTAFALRVVHPWYDEAGDLIGYVETGQEVEKFLEIMSEQTGDEVALLLKKDGLDAEAWATMRENRDEEDNWDEFPDFVVAYTTDEAIGGNSIEGFDIDSLPEDGDIFSDKVEGGTPTALGAFPVTNTLGERAGAVIVERDISELADNLNASRTQTVFLLVAVGVLLIGIVILMLNALVFRRLNSMIANMEDASTRLAGGDFDINLPEPKSDDEIGQFEKFFAGFLGAVSSTLKQLSGK